jgi:hypothetical protein
LFGVLASVKFLDQERKRPFWMHRNGWEDNIKADK